DKRFPPGKLPGDPRFTHLYVNTSTGEGDMAGPWNRGEQWEVLTPTADNIPVDAGDGQASIELNGDESAAVGLFATRGASDPTRDPVTGADLGSLKQEP